MSRINSLIKINNKSPLSIHLQIKEQIKWLIGNDLLKPGDLLPSTNELARQLSINRNTIQAVYSELREKGLLRTKRGSGTEVTTKKQIIQFKNEHPYFGFIEQTIKEGDKAGYDMEKMLLSGFAYIQLFEERIKQKRRYLFIECKVSSCIFYLNEIKRRTTATIEKVDVSIPKEKLMKAVKSADIIVTRADLTESIKNYINDPTKKIISVGDTNDIALLLDMISV